jgi:hypothetical protein
MHIFVTIPYATACAYSVVKLDGGGLHEADCLTPPGPSWTKYCRYQGDLAYLNLLKGISSPAHIVSSEERQLLFSMWLLPYAPHVMIADELLFARKVKIHHFIEAVLLMLCHDRYGRALSHRNKLQLLHNLLEAVRILFKQHPVD